jgi:hypothetical protein
MLRILHLCGFKIISGIRSSIQYEFSLNLSGLTHYCYQSAVLIQEGFINGIAGAGLSFRSISSQDRSRQAEYFVAGAKFSAASFRPRGKGMGFGFCVVALL